ncbi:adenylate/guanylate cyclase [Tolypothrix sp. NIES-4075]|uniref:adenylate/guanylate cyclase domain-containing protein n=1 Tax=Tolypothrix sp. NIES-4075 TaxID=2005459 RepID=UPI000B5C938E|nr:adenylate/guanylate cyclase domain-containing protein [Tolypothrix sp. NIES-4075]GAX44365.1 adenylate/guanylate cyclase [Tolypothrix sp. NIES-4075]
MKYQVLDRIFNKALSLRKFERLELNENFCIIDTSEQVQRFAHRPEEVMLGKDVRLSFPEFIGIEDILISILQGKQELFELESIKRFSEDKSDIYINIYILSEAGENESDNRLVILLEDITEKIFFQQNHKQKVNESNLLLHTLVTYKNYMDQVITSMADAFLVTTNCGKIKKVNRAAQKLFGFSEQELINQPISLIIEDNFLLQKAITQHSLYHKYFQNIELVCRTKKREKLLIAFSCSVIQKKIDGLEDIVYIGRDITARERRQQRHAVQYAITRILSESQSVKQAISKILQAICENLGWDLGQLWTANEYLTTSASREKKDKINPILRCVEMWSSRTISVREFKAIAWQTTYTLGDGFPGRIWARRSPLWTRDIVHSSDFSRTQKAVATTLHAAFGFPIMDDNEVLGVMVFFSREVQPKDVDLLQMMGSISSQIIHFLKHKQASELLLESEERYRDLFENANDLIQSVNAYGRFEYVNRAWRETLGYSEAEVTQMNVFDIIHPDFQSSCRQMFYRVLSGEKIEQFPATFVTKYGQKIFVEGNINCKLVRGKPVATRGIFRNITQRLEAEQALHHQQKQTEGLLLNILPEAIANRLKQPGTIAEDFADITVLFADIVGLTEIASSVSAIQLVKLLNQIFSSFDRLSDQYNLEKIKTIDDGYMVVGGLPRHRADHASAIALMALDMQSAIAQFNAKNQQNFSIRIGIHSGSAVPAPIGIKNLTSDWEDTVNIASRMESQGFTNKIQVSETTYQHLRDEFLFEKRGEIEVKGKGMTTYLLIGRKVMGNG